MIDTLDTERLHAVIEGKLVGRGVGKTTAMLTQLLGIAQVGNAYAETMIVTHTDTWAKQLMRIFSDVLVEEHIKHNLMSTTELYVVPNGQRFIFVTIGDILNNRRCVGIRLYNYFLDMPDNYVEQYEPHLKEWLEPRLISTGDVYAY